MALLGRNGAGKTTLLRCLVGLLSPSAGRMLLHGRDIGAWPSFRRARGRIGYAPQGREIFSNLSVGENLLIAAKSHGVRDGAALGEVCTLFPVLRAMWRPGGAAATCRAASSSNWRSAAP